MMKFGVVVLLFIFLVSCHLLLSTVVPRVGGGNVLQGTVQVQPVNETVLSPNTKIVRFPNQVTSQQLQEPAPLDILEIVRTLKSAGVDVVHLSALSSNLQTKISKQGIFIASFSSLASSQNTEQIKIPETGSFQLRLHEGSAFKILDRDATDGKAEIQMPPSTLQTWLHVSQEWSETSVLEIEDPLYYIKDILSYSNKPWLSQKKWLKIGTRPLPIPVAWGSSEGQDYVLNFTTKAVSTFQMGWVSRNETPADQPFGIQEIGSEGGTIELPGVGKLEIPAGAFDETRVVSMMQLKENMSFNNEVQISPAIRIMLSGSKVLNKKLLVNLNVDRDVVGKNHPGVIEYYQPVDCLDAEDSFCVTSLGSPDSIDTTTFNSFYYVDSPGSIVYASIRKIYLNQEFTPINPEMPLLPAFMI